MGCHSHGDCFYRPLEYLGSSSVVDVRHQAAEPTLLHHYRCPNCNRSYSSPVEPTFEEHDGERHCTTRIGDL